MRATAAGPRCLVATCLVCLGLAPAAADDTGYQKPPEAIRAILQAPTFPQLSLNPTRTHFALLHSARYPSIEELAEPMLRLAGLRINPRTNGSHQPLSLVRIEVLDLSGKQVASIDRPGDRRLGMPGWSPDGKRLAWTETTATGIRLHVLDLTSGKRTAPDIQLNGVMGVPFQWLPGSEELLCKTIPAERGSAPKVPAVPRGPIVQESSGINAPARTFQDLLQTPHDEALFDYYARSQLVRVHAATGKMERIGGPDLWAGVSESPDGKFLLTTRLHRPYSYLLPYSAFPRQVAVLDRNGKQILEVANLPLAEKVPIDGVPTGPRSVRWLPHQPATLYWIEALDGGDPRKKVPHRDVVKTQTIGEAQARELLKTEQRFQDLDWNEKGDVAVLKDYNRERRRQRTYLLSPSEPEKLTLLTDRSINDRYNDPGDFLQKTLPTDQRVLLQEGDSLFLNGRGATPRGDRPFVDRFDLKTRKAERLFHSAAEAYEEVVALLEPDGSRLLLRHETNALPPNYFLVERGERRPLTAFKDPAPQLRKIKKELITYKRADGVPLSMTLYLPPDHQPGQRLPAVVWAYPREFTDVSTAGQVSATPNRFTLLSGMSHLFFLLQGYAVLDNATMPVIGDPEKANDTYIDQIVSSAKAAIDKADELGVIDPRRVGVGGHSYGAFMTANLLAHSDLFRAGIARSGAYNRTLTPFGFQAEPRTIWEAPDTYLKMSPFLYAHKIKEPLLLIHGEADNNPGTFPVQSERMYHALKGNGGTVRFVSLPLESHGYAALESIEHTLYEMLAWFDRHVKHAPATGTPTAGQN